MAMSKSISVHIALIFCNVIWACDYPFYSLVLGRYLSPMAMVTASLLIAALLSLIPMLWQPYEKVESSDRLKILCAALLMGVARKLCMMFGLAQTSAIDGSIIGTTTPLLVLLLSILIGVEKFSTLRICGLLLGMAGAVAVIVSSGGDKHVNSSVWGNILILSSTCVSALYMVWFRRILSKYRVTTILRWIYCTSAAVLLPFGVDDMLSVNVSAMHAEIIFATLFVLIVPTYLPNLLLNYSLRRIAPTVSSIYAYLQPVIAIALAVAMGLDKLHWDMVIFALIIFLGVGIVIRSYRTTTT